jgi:SAM-dependent methyltransferase
VADHPSDGALRPGPAGRRPKRIDARRLRPWRQDYLVYRYLWPDIERAVARARREVGVERPLVLDVGCGNRPYADLFEGCRYLGVDRSTEDAITDAVTDATRLGFKDACFDIVFCTQVVEHVPAPASVVGETFRVLKPGGFLVLTGPFWWPCTRSHTTFSGSAGTASRTCWRPRGSTTSRSFPTVATGRSCS